MRIVGRRFGSLVLTMAIVLATAAAALVPTVALADTSYTTCPLFSQFKSDVEAISGTGTVTFLAPYCNMTANSTITVQSDANVTIKGDGLTLTGGTPSARGAFALFSVGANASLSVDYRNARVRPVCDHSGAICHACERRPWQTAPITGMRDRWCCLLVASDRQQQHDLR